MERYLSWKGDFFGQLRFQEQMKGGGLTEARGVPAMVHSLAIIGARAWKAVFGPLMGVTVVEDRDWVVLGF